MQRLALILGLALSLFFRLWRIDEFISVDEHRWRERSIAFYQGLVDGDYIQTCRTEHPGVITMWAGVGGYCIAERLKDAEVSSPLLHRVLYPLEHDQGTGLYPETMWARRIIALTTWLGVIGVYLLGKRFLSPDVNLLATLLLALDPFYLAYSRLHHLDGLLSCFVALSLWALVSYCERGGRRYLLLSGAMAALATLSKAPGVLLGLGMVVTLGWYGWRGRASRPGWVKRALEDALLWTGIAVAVGFAAWPAMWSSPAFAVKRVYDGVMNQVSKPHENGVFFMGSFRLDPGPLYYPVAWAMRTTPFIIVGLLALPFATRRGAQRTPAVAMLLFTLVFGVFVTLSLKKGDRYLLPIFPALCLPAGVGLRWLVDRMAQRWRQWRWLSPAMGALSIATYLAILLSATPYYTAYFNPLLGGAATGPRVLLIGWGEGLEQAARYLNAQPNAKALHVSSMSPSEFEPFFAGYTTLAGQEPLVDPDYFVTYASHVQRGFVPELLAAVEGQEPEFVARAPNGLAYAWVYPNRVDAEQIESVLAQVDADPAGALLLLNTSPAAVRRAPYDIEAISTERLDYMLTELERINNTYGAVWFVTFNQAHESSTEAMRQALDRFAWPQKTHQIGDIVATRYGLAASRFVNEQGNAPRRCVVGDQIEFLGYDRLLYLVEPGDTLTLFLHWRANSQVDSDYKVFVHLVGADEQIIAQSDSAPQGGARPTTTWQPGQVILDEHTLTIPADAPAGDYAAYIGMYDESTMQRLPVRDEDNAPVAHDCLRIIELSVAP